MGILSNLRGWVRGILEEPKPCYRCGDVRATETFAGYPYCRMCAKVVPLMNATVAHDPPFGFPGAAGHTTFVKKVALKGDEPCTKQAPSDPTGS